MDVGAAYALHDAAAVDEPHPPAEEAAEAQDENQGGNTVPSESEIANPRVMNAPIMPHSAHDAAHPSLDLMATPACPAKCCEAGV